VKEFSKLSNSW